MGGAKRILAYDLATRFCGYTVGDGSCMPEVDGFELPGPDDLGRLGARARAAFIAQVQRYRPDVVLNERPELIPGRDTLTKIRPLHGVSFTLATVCAQFGIPYEEETVKAVKAELTGDAGADKNAMCAVAVKVGVTLPDEPWRRDAADSFAVWLCGVRKHSRVHLAEWDRRIHSRRGAML